MVGKLYKAIQNIILIISILTLLSLIIFIGILNMHIVVVVSGSMEPNIKTGSICLINPNYEMIDRGDVISYIKDDISVTHRVIDVNPSGYITKGDNNECPDPGIVKQNKIVGKCVFVIPGIGYMVMLMKTREGVIVMFSLVAAFLLIGLLLNKRKGCSR